jgi:hypothetical protein
MNIKVIAVSKTGTYGDWKIIAEIDASLMFQLTRVENSTPPLPGNAFDITGTLKRLEELESRERDITVLTQLMQKITAPKIEPKAEQ